MKYAIVNNFKQEAINTGERGKCICCGAEMVANCGPVKIKHWKHKSLRECDSWTEPETEWHREWKNNFPKEFQEVVKYDQITREKHVADIFNSSQGLTIEIQHSPIRQDEIKSREAFYNKMIWIVDLIPYKKNIIFHKDIEEAFFEEIMIKWATRQESKIRQLESKSNTEEANKLRGRGWEDDYFDSFQKKYNPFTEKENYYLMLWKYQPKHWNSPICPLFFDFGDEFIFMSVEIIKIGNGFLVKRFFKREFIEKYNKT